MIGVVAVGLGALLSANVGANNSAAEMGAAYGAGIRSKRAALTLIAIFAFLGAVTAGIPVIKTLGGGLVPTSVCASHVAASVFLVMTLAVLYDGLANWLGTPVPTTHAVVCGIVGVGLAFGALNLKKFAAIVGWWIAGPFISFGVNYLFEKSLYFRVLERLTRRLHSQEAISGLLGALVTVTGCYIAYSGGANGAAKGIGPVVGAGLLQAGPAAAIAGASISVGALLWGGRVLDTVGRKITEIGVLRAIVLEFAAATLMLAAAGSGIPLSITETVTAGVIGVSAARHGWRETRENEHVARILAFWVAGPVVITATAWALARAGHAWLGW